MSGGREATHFAADLGQDDFGAEDADAWNGGQELDWGAKGLDIGVDLLIDLFDRRVDGVDLLQVQSQQEAVTPGDAAAQRFTQRRGRRLDAAVGQLLGAYGNGPICAPGIGPMKCA